MELKLKPINLILYLFLIIRLPVFSQPTKVDLIEKVPLGGMEQTILIRGSDINNPLLLVLHGGPGFSEFIFFRTYNQELETKYTVVNWDQRGSGLSYSEFTDPKTMTIEQFVSDAHELVQLLKKKYNKKKIVVLGHSWGTLLGIKLVQQYPEDFFCYIGAGQFVSGIENERLSLAYTLKKATAANNLKAIKELTAIAHTYPYKDTLPLSVDQQLINLQIQRRWLEIFGGIFQANLNYRILFKNTNKKEMALYDEVRSGKGEIFSMTNLWTQVLLNDLSKSSLKIAVPVYLLLGKTDYNTPFELAEQYFNLIQSPAKQLIWFEKSGHFMPFEEPKKFNDVLLNSIYKETQVID